MASAKGRTEGAVTPTAATKMDLPDRERRDSPFEYFRELGRRDARFDPERNRAVNRVIAQVRARERERAA